MKQQNQNLIDSVVWCTGINSNAIFICQMIFLSIGQYLQISNAKSLIFDIYLYNLTAKCIFITFQQGSDIAVLSRIN